MAENAIWVVDYGGGNVRSLRNALRALGYATMDIAKPEDFSIAKRVVFPGVGAFAAAVEGLKIRGLWDALKKYVQDSIDGVSGKSFLGICIGLQVLFEWSEESGQHCAGLGLAHGVVSEFDSSKVGSVPHIGWNGVSGGIIEDADKVYFVHSYRIGNRPGTAESWEKFFTHYGNDIFISMAIKGRAAGVQFHPEKSGKVGLAFIRKWAEGRLRDSDKNISASSDQMKITKRIIACLDVRCNDAGDLVVTKGDQYDVRERSDDRNVRNMGKPVALAQKYYEDGADELTFLNITSFREFPLQDAPMLHLLEAVSSNVFVPLTVGGGIRDYTDSRGHFTSAFDVASAYFRSGADKISLGSDAVLIAENFWAMNGNMPEDKPTSIQRISSVYGRQAVVISLDPKRIYVRSPQETSHATVHCGSRGRIGPNGEEYCWYQCTVKGGRELRDIDVVQVAKACEKLGAGEILLNCIDEDGQGNGYDLDLVSQVKSAVSIPVIASSGAGTPSHFVQVFKDTNCDAALAAGIFHRGEVSIQQVKQQCQDSGISMRL